MKVQHAYRGRSRRRPELSRREWRLLIVDVTPRLHALKNQVLLE